MVFEAHSTDYQSRSALKALVEDHFAILKVGPGLTFAYREALFALAQIESELLGDRASQVRATLDRAMVADPSHWRDFYPEDEARSSLSRRYSRSDRSRYYWSVPEVRDAVDRMLVNLDRVAVPDELVSQHLPWLRGAEPPGASVGLDSAEAVLRSAIGVVLDAYASATQ
jgi:D-tagatose-1,6-bisphosphate aldolase subunit GatZ/KbaZ